MAARNQSSRYTFLFEITNMKLLDWRSSFQARNADAHINGWIDSSWSTCCQNLSLDVFNPLNILITFSSQEDHNPRCLNKNQYLGKGKPDYHEVYVLLHQLFLNHMQVPRLAVNIRLNLLQLSTLKEVAGIWS